MNCSRSAYEIIKLFARVSMATMLVGTIVISVMWFVLSQQPKGASWAYNNATDPHFIGR